MSQPRCDECRYWQWDADAAARGRRTDTGECRKQAPQLTSPRWPTVRENEWCGEWTPKQKPYDDKLSEALWGPKGK